LDDALDRLARTDPRQAEIVELHHFGGWTLTEVAEMLEVSVSTAKGEWAAGKAWLQREVCRGNER
jgi:RNA polymerase sigma factor (sigma-70 family)